MASDSGDAGTSDISDLDDTGVDPGSSTSGGVITLDYEDGKFINHDTGEEVSESPPNPSDLLPDWLWAQHNAPPPQEPEE